MNVRLLRKVAKHVAAEPKRLCMDVTLSTLDTTRTERYVNWPMPPCGTVGCIAGWTCVLSNSIPAHFEGIIRTAREKLDLTGGEADALFAEPRLSLGNYPEYERMWPRRFAKRYLAAKTPRGRASATVARIEHFIKTKGAE